MTKTTTGDVGGRPTIMSRHGVVTSGHYLATDIGVQVLRSGGNAMDAAAAVGFALAVLQPHQNGIAGETPMLVYSAHEKEVWALSGNGTAPRAATLRKFQELGLDVIPGDGFLPATAPPAVASWILLLRRFGRKRLADVLAPAVDLAEHGFPMYDSLRSTIESSAERFRQEWPSSAKTFLHRGKPPEVGSLWRNPDWAATLKRLISAEARHTRREEGLHAAHDEFYRGNIAQKIVAFCSTNAVRDSSGKSHKCLLTADDFASYEAYIEEAPSTKWRDMTIHKCGPWTQGPVLLQSLNLLSCFDLVTMGHNSGDYIHTIVECMKLAFADREFYYGDPDFVDVPLRRLLSRKYAEERSALVDPKTASLELRPGEHPALSAKSIREVDRALWKGISRHGDTTKLEVIDAAGNMVSATPSGGWLQASPVIPGMGFPLGTRGQMFSLVAGHPNALHPGKRPRTTLTPSLATRDGKPFMAFGSPGGDCQDQWALQFLLNVTLFGMSLQEAVEAPTFWTHHFPSSFYPRAAEPGSLYVEGRIAESIRKELASRGHVVHAAGDWSGGNTLAASIDPRTGLRHAAASPRLDPAYAAGV